MRCSRRGSPSGGDEGMHPSHGGVKGAKELPREDGCKLVAEDSLLRRRLSLKDGYSLVEI